MKNMIENVLKLVKIIGCVLIALYVSLVWFKFSQYLIEGNKSDKSINTTIKQIPKDTVGQGYINMMISDSLLCPDGKCKCK